LWSLLGQRWERTSRAHNLLTDPEFPVSTESPTAVLEASYAAGTTDEFLEPTRLSACHLQEGDALLMFNFRPDRARQIIQSLTLEDFEGFSRPHRPKLDVVTFTQYESGLPVKVAFPPESLDDLLGQVVASEGLKQYRTAETEKYPHVTYFMNGGIEQPLEGEDRHLVPSPRVATYDQAPAMAAEALTDSCIAAIEKGVYSLVVINYANPDMVGHTGVMEAATEAIETVDHCIGRLLDAVGRVGGTIMITADHGNAECMRGDDGQAWTAHTTNPVPVILVEGEKRKMVGMGNSLRLRDEGGLADIAPTLLQLLGLEKPDAMTGHSLIEAIDTAAPSTARLPQPV
jgi:2,3-bisphosphoglycerate-independent phosphoglycerate mutase